MLLFLEGQGWEQYWSKLRMIIKAITWKKKKKKKIGYQKVKI